MVPAGDPSSETLTAGLMGDACRRKISRVATKSLEVWKLVRFIVRSHSANTKLIHQFIINVKPDKFNNK